MRNVSSRPNFAQRTAYRLRIAWGKLRPIPMPVYLRDTPRTGGDNEWNPHFPPTAMTLGVEVLSREATHCVMAVLDRLMPTPELELSKFFFLWGPAIYGDSWRQATLHTGAWAAAKLVQPKSYLEIGVHRGRSAAIVGATCPNCHIYGFDLWIADYAGEENPGPEFVRSELRAVGHAGTVTLVSGDSGETLPAFLREHPDLYFDMITVDGTKSVVGVASDFASALPRLKVGGVVLNDDLPLFPPLRRIWRTMIEKDRRFSCWEFNDSRFGVALAVRVAE